MKTIGKVTIKKYANRRLYDTESPSYITHDRLGALISEGRDFDVSDAESADDSPHDETDQHTVEERAGGTGGGVCRKGRGDGLGGGNSGGRLGGTEREGIQRGIVRAKPGSSTPQTHFKAQVYVLSKEEGGRHTPFFTNYRPQFYFRTTDVTGSITLEEGVEMVMPGDNTVMEVKLITPIAMEEGLRFAIREGGHTVGAGAVTSIIE